MAFCCDTEVIMTDVILDVSHIAKTFGHVQALKDITLSLRKGRVHTLLGENGAGKSSYNLHQKCRRINAVLSVYMSLYRQSS